MATRLAWAALVLSIASGGAASAIDLTGIWADKKDYPCTHTDIHGTRTAPQTMPPLRIAQTTGGLLAINWHEDTLRPWVGRVFEDAKGLGRGLAHDCAATQSEATLEIVSASTFPVNANGVSGRLIVVYRDVYDHAYNVCRRVVFERVSTTSGDLAPCP